MINFPRYRNLLVSVALFTLLLLTFTYVLHDQYAKSQAQDRSVINLYEVISQGRRVLINLVNMETGQRGYLLSGNKDFLEPYELGLERVDDAYIKLKALTQDTDAESTDTINQVGTLIEQDKALLAEQLKKFSRSRATQYPLTLNDMWAGKEVMDKIRDLLTSYLRDQNMQLNTSIAAWHDRQRDYTWFLFAGALAMLAALTGSNYIMMRAGERAQQTEEQLKHLEEGYRLLLAGMNDGTYDYQPATGYMYLSSSHERLLGYGPDELPNRIETINNLLHPDDYAAAWEMANRYMRREIPNFSVTFRLLHKNGDWRWILSRGVGVWDENGEIRRLVGIHTDITSQKQRESELQQLNSELESFTYIASHDLRGPLINIKGFAGEVDYTLRQIQPQLDRHAATLTGAEQKEFVQALALDIPEALGFIRAAVDKMDKLTTAILDLSRIGRRIYKNEEIDTALVVQTCVKSLAYEITQKNITVECHNLPRVRADEVALEQVFGNLLDNAVKYMDTSRPGRIIVKAEMTPSDYEFTVADNGTGIGELDKKKVFDIFRRGANARDTRGIGMGMAYVKTTLRKLGGRVWFDSVLGEGTTFHFTLPHDYVQHSRSETAT